MPANLPRRFHLQRHRDISGVSGTGRVAVGVQWPDGTASVRWLGERPSTVVWDSMADAEHVHGHGGATEIVWDDEEQPAVPEQRAPGAGRATADTITDDQLDALYDQLAQQAHTLHRVRRLVTDHEHAGGAAANSVLGAIRQALTSNPPYRADLRSDSHHKKDSTGEPDVT